jgi:hypothetical protein
MTKNISLLLLGVASMGLSRIAFLFVNDPEGPNLLIVTALAAVIFAVSLAVYAGIRRLGRSA